MSNDQYGDFEHLDVQDISGFPEFNPSITCMSCNQIGAKVVELENGNIRLCKLCFGELQIVMCYTPPM